jgi:hypothetical protein
MDDIRTVFLNAHCGEIEIDGAGVGGRIDATYDYAQRWIDTSGFGKQEKTPGIKTLMRMSGQFAADESSASAMASKSCPYSVTLLLGLSSLPPALSVRIESSPTPNVYVFSFSQERT